jgi:hypothetical protein
MALLCSCVCSDLEFDNGLVFPSLCLPLLRACLPFYSDVGLRVVIGTAGKSQTHIPAARGCSVGADRPRGCQQCGVDAHPTPCNSYSAAPGRGGCAAGRHAGGSDGGGRTNPRPRPTFCADNNSGEAASLYHQTHPHPHSHCHTVPYASYSCCCYCCVDTRSSPPARHSGSSFFF